MSTTTYVIRNAGQYESTLGACGSPIRTTEYRRVRDAARDVAKVARLGDGEMHVVGPCGEADWYVYANEEDADADADGSRALAIIVSRASYQRDLDAGVFEEA